MMLSTAAASDTIVTTTSACSTACLGFCAIRILSEDTVEARSADLSHPVTCKPPRAALRASAAPMMPNPRMATFVLMQIRCGARRLDAPVHIVEMRLSAPRQKCHPDRSGHGLRPTQGDQKLLLLVL